MKDKAADDQRQLKLVAVSWGPQFLLAGTKKGLWKFIPFLDPVGKQLEQLAMRPDQER